MIFQRRIDLDDFAGRWREELRDCLHRLDRSERFASVHTAADVRQLDEDHVAELLLCVIGDPDLSDVGRHTHPLVILRVLQVSRIRHLSS